MKKQSLIAIAGPTATGKSTVAVELSARLDGEVISADSAQVYRELNIGTAKLTQEQMFSKRGTFIPHHCIDIVDVDCDYNIGLYQRDARRAIENIVNRDKRPILCGGSGLYLYSVINSTYDLSEPAGNPEQRARWLEEEEVRGEGYLHRLLTERFPRRAAKIHPHDYQRILRGLEQERDLDEEIADFWASDYNLSIFGLTIERSLLYERIEKRVEEMFRLGLVNEVQTLLQRGYRPDSNALMALGYKEVVPVITGEYDEERAKELLKRNTRRFAKRQITWFKRDPRIDWLDVSVYSSADELCEEILERLSKAGRKTGSKNEYDKE